MTEQNDLSFYPANGTDGAQFEENWCAHCLNEMQPDWEDEFGNDVPGKCDVLSRAAFYPVPEWVYRHGVPWCLAFRQDPARPARCLFTKEMTV
ncbi:MAG: hypothetical protein DI604_17930 [Delftia acidovorans]|nr:MAG: hypothetical protein DI604_17930 [Delftia acidovorans]